nr:Chain E, RETINOBLASTOMA-ASSOCIATED PROTEIN [Homo sapiens]
PPKPLKKLRFD